MQISSTANPRIKSLRALRQRKARDASGHFLIEGIRPVAEAVAHQASLVELVIAPELLRSQYGLELVATQRQRGVPTLEVSASVFATLAEKDGPQGILAVAEQRSTPLHAVDVHAGIAWVALDQTQDPGNLGTILRTCDAVGAAGVILLGATADPYDPAAVRASMGALFSQHIVRSDVTELLAWLPSSGLTLVGTSDAATMSYRAYQYPQPLLLLMGSERAGIRAPLAAACAASVAIPMRGTSDSLNLAVATGVLLYEVLHQRLAATTDVKLAMT